MRLYCASLRTARAHRHTHTHTCARAHTHTQRDTQTHKDTHTHTHADAYTHTHTHAHTHTQAHTHTHTHICAEETLTTNCSTGSAATFILLGAHRGLVSLVGGATTQSQHTDLPAHVKLSKATSGRGSGWPYYKIAAPPPHIF